MTARYLLLFLALTVFLFPSYSRDINTAIDQLYNFQISESINTLERMALDYPEDPLIPFLRISAYWQRSLLYENPESSYEVIKDGIRRAVPFYIDMIEKYPENQRYNLFLGSLYGLKARINLAQSEWMSLVISGSKGFKYISDAIKNDSSLYDAYMPIGTLEYFLCRSNPALQIIGEMFGLESDCKEAIDKLEIASEKAEYSWVEARNVLSYIYLYIERDYRKAFDHSRSLTESFPGHPFFLYLEAESLIKLREYEKFEDIEKTLIEFYEEGPPNQKSECHDKYLYLNALRAFQEEKYQLAIEFSSEVIDGYSTEFQWVLGYAHLIRGKSIEITGDRAMAIMDYRYAVRYLDNYPDKDDAQALIFSSISEISRSR